MGANPKNRRGAPRDWESLYSLMIRDEAPVEGASLVPPWTSTKRGTRSR